MIQPLKTKIREMYGNLDHQLRPDQLEIVIDKTEKHIKKTWTEYLNKEISHDELLLKENSFVEYLYKMIKEFEEKGGG